MFLLLLVTLIVVAGSWVLVTVLRNRSTVARFQKLFPKFVCVPSVPILGSAYLFKDATPAGIFRTITGWHQVYGRNLIRQGLFNKPSVQICNPAVIEQVLQAKTIEKTIAYDFMKPWLGSGLVVSTGAKWAERRKVITPTFHFKILEDFLVIMNHQTDVLIEKLGAQVGGPDFDIYEHVTYCALDIISESAMGVKLNTQHNPHTEYVKAVKELSAITFKRLFSLAREYKWVFRLQEASRRQDKLMKVMHEFAQQVISERKKQLEDERERQRANQKLEETDVYGKRRMTLLDLLLNVTIDGKPLSNIDIREEVDTFMAAGHDTTTSCISFACYHLSRNPAIQQKVYEEIQKIIGPDAGRIELTNSTLQDLRYLDQVIKETLRMNPSVPIIGRRSAGDMTIDGVPVPKGMEFGVLIYALHNDPELYPEPERFDPERFSDEAQAARPPYSYIPFSVGARNCIGQRYAMLEIKTMLVKVLANYKLLPCEDNNRAFLQADITLKPVNGAFVKVVNRH
ncbi:cytochrome P450 4d2-like [Anopheles aquasalis]|uniref:cytochrome P450 4d2-like n=1 Tax=Anopheles aquasalis TaxID=42839 RepID=UPI00215A93ED|nr:cytochrome P450 4d2-like [Anopheles aquasalis]XP_050089168.1 cytochrome P450 4d2-like [Anopheles aquasalis]